VTIRVRASALGYGPCRGRWWAIQRRKTVTDAGYELQDGRQTHIGAPLGSGVHAGAALLLGRLASTGEMGGAPRIKEAQDCALTVFEERAPQDLIVDRLTPSRDEARKSIARMVELGATTIDPKDEPLLVESTLEMQFRNGVVLTGTPDRYLIQRPREGGRLPDLKTGRYHPVAAGEQLGAQSLLVRARYGTAAIAWVGVEAQPRGLAKNVRPPVPIKMPQGVCERLALGAVEQIKRDHEAWDAEPNTDTIQKMPTDFLCSERYCPAYGVRGPNAWCSAWLLKDETKK
jgi:hypothetical protein